MLHTTPLSPSDGDVALAEAVAVRRERDHLVGRVHDGWDVFSVPHGGYLAALAGSAALSASGAPDIFTLTVHYLRKAATGPVLFEASPVGGSRRFTTWALTVLQDDEPVMTALASVGDRTTLAGPDWTDQPPPGTEDVDWTPPAGTPGEPFPTPAVAQRLGQQLDLDTVGFTRGATDDHAVIRSRVGTAVPDQLAAILACDITPPAAWNALGMRGWVPTVELTAHVRHRPSPGPLTVEARTRHVTDGFLEEDALVRDADGLVVVQSRQLARWTATG